MVYKMRTSKKDLYFMIDRINHILEEKGMKNSYSLNIAYGGYRLVQLTETGGERDISYRMTCKELYYALLAIENVLINSL